MRIRHISSKANPVLKKFYRASSGSEYALIEGRKLLEDALTAGVQLQYVIAAESARPELKNLLNRCDEVGTNLISVPDKLFAAVSDVITNQGIAALAIPKLATLDEIRLSGKPLLAVAEAVQDPGNMGAITRSAAAFGADAFIMLHGCANPFGPKAIRGAAGATFRLPVAKARAEELMAWLRSKDIEAVGLDAHGNTPLRSFDFNRPCAIIIGSEGIGLSTFLQGEVDVLLRIPIENTVESLNVAVAASIALFEASRQRTEV